MPGRMSNSPRLPGSQRTPPDAQPAFSTAKSMSSEDSQGKYRSEQQHCSQLVRNQRNYPTHVLLEGLQVFLHQSCIVAKRVHSALGDIYPLCLLQDSIVQQRGYKGVVWLSTISI